MDLALAAVGLLDRRIPNPQTSPHDIRTDTVTFDVSEDGMIGDDEPAVLDG